MPKVEEAPRGLFVFYPTQERRLRAIYKRIATTLLVSVALASSTATAVAVPQHKHHVKGCNTHACDVRVGRAWARTHQPWHEAGASIFGEPCESGNQGYRGADLNGQPEVSFGSLPHGWYFAELNMGSAMGGLPNNATIRIESPSTHRETIIVKGDIGAGGGPVAGKSRDIDLYAPVAKWLANASCEWTGVIRWQKIG